MPNNQYPIPGTIEFPRPYAEWETEEDVYPLCPLCKQPQHPVEHASGHRHGAGSAKPSAESRVWLEAEYLAKLQARARTRQEAARGGS